MWWKLKWSVRIRPPWFKNQQETLSREGREQILTLRKKSQKWKGWAKKSLWFTKCVAFCVRSANVRASLIFGFYRKCNNLLSVCLFCCRPISEERGWMRTTVYRFCKFCSSREIETSELKYIYIYLDLLNGIHAESFFVFIILIDRQHYTACSTINLSTNRNII